MNGTKHILICGEVGSGKSTLISRLLNACILQRYGFISKRRQEEVDGFHPIYIFPAGLPEGERQFTAANLIGTCNGKTRQVNREAFDVLGVQYLREAKNDGVIVMDELGFMESEAAGFTAAVFEALNGDIPVIAAVKARFDIPFLNQVRTHPKAELYMLGKDSREDLYNTLLPKLRDWQTQYLAK